MPRRSLAYSLLTLLCLAACEHTDDGKPAVDGATPPGTRARAQQLLDEIIGPSTGPVIRESRAFQFSETQLKPAEAPSAEAPISLTASDGTGLRMVALDARGVLEPPLGFTELRMTFENPANRTIEGRFRIGLPPDASISRFAMKIGDRWQEGEVVERQAARRAYEDFLHRKQDPALLEQQAGNEFTARVFPIPARGRKEIILSYSQELSSQNERYKIPLRGLPQLGELSVQVYVRSKDAGAEASSLGGRRRSHEIVEVRKKAWTPDADFSVAQPEIPGRIGVRSGTLAVARIAPIAKVLPDEPDSLFVLMDTSASRALGFTSQVKLVQTLIAGLAAGKGADVPVAVGCFDQMGEICFDGTAGEFDAEAAAKILDRRALGASNIHAALGWLGSLATDEGRTFRRVLLVSDGVATVGATEGSDLRQAIAALGKVGVERLDALVVGGLRDEDLLHRLVTAGLPRDGTVIDGDAPLAEVAFKLSQATYSGLEVTVPGAAWVWPKRLDGIQPGDEVLVFAELDPNVPFDLRVSGHSVVPEGAVLTRTERPLLERAWVRARIRRIEGQRDTMAADDPDLRKALKTQIIDLSVRHRVLSSYTALLVLETEQDYARFQIDRNALSDILTVGGNGLDVMKRSAATIVASRTPPPPATNKGKSKKSDAPQLRAPPPPSAAPADGLADAGADNDMDMAMEAEPMEEAKSMASESMAGAAAPLMDAPAAVPAMEAPPAPSRPASRADRPRRRAQRRSRPRDRRPPQGRVERRPPPAAKPSQADPYAGPFKEVMAFLRSNQKSAARERALAWRDSSPGDVMALTALGEVFEAEGDLEEAARAYGSLIDLFPSRADLRRYAGQRLERLASRFALELAVDTYGKAVEQRPDHPASHRLYAFALVKVGRYADAFTALEVALRRDYPSGRFAGVKRILAEDMGLVAAAWIAKEGNRRDEILEALSSANGTPATGASLRFVLYWETDANDVDFHIYDGKGGHAYYSSPQLVSGGELYADVTTGYGPECFTVPMEDGRRSYPYVLQAHYYSRGPMGYGMGKLQIVEHDGEGDLRFAERPFVVMQDGAYLDLGRVEGRLAAAD